jgi:hypothetical protein
MPPCGNHHTRQQGGDSCPRTGTGGTTVPSQPSVALWSAATSLARSAAMARHGGPGRADRRLHLGIHQPDQEPATEELSAWLTRPLLDPKGPGQRGGAGRLQGLAARMPAEYPRPEGPASALASLNSSPNCRAAKHCGHADRRCAHRRTSPSPCHATWRCAACECDIRRPPC